MVVRTAVGVLGTEAVQEIIDRVRAYGDCNIELLTDESKSVCVTGRRRDGAVHLTIDSEGEEFSMSSDVFEPALTRPSGYASDLPFVVGVEASVSRVSRVRKPPHRAVVWIGTDDASSLMSDVVAQSVAVGWTTVKGEGIPVQLSKGPVTRSLTVLPGGRLRNKLMLWETTLTGGAE